MKKEKGMVEIWGDVIEIRSLIFATFISIITTMGAFFLAPSENKTYQFYFGLVGTVIGFLINTLIIKPKRIIEEEVDD